MVDNVKGRREEKKKEGKMHVRDCLRLEKK